ncbi:MAG: acetyl-CoA carboxylase biotin carboxyl carrier protein subunit [Acetobacterales bacterium]
MASTDFDEDFIRRLADLLDEKGLTEIEVEAEDRRVRVAREPAPVTMAGGRATAAAPSAAPATDIPRPTDSSHPGAVTSPMVGLAYIREEPTAPAYVEVGSTVREGQTLCLIEAMKTFNPVRSPRSGTVTQIFISDQSPVEYDEVLMIIE